MKQRTVAEHRRCQYCGGFMRDEGDPLTRQQRMVIDYLEHQSRPMSAARIAAHIRVRRASTEYNFHAEVANVRVVISEIRKVLGTQAILTIRHEGYVLGHVTAVSTA